MHKRLIRFVAVALLLSVLVIGLASSAGAQDDPRNPLESPITVYSIEVLETYEHDSGSFTQGLLYHDGLLYESAGQYGRSQLREVDPETGEVLEAVDVPEEYFAEGLELVDGRLIQLTWRENTAFVYDLETFEQLDTITYEGEGWGLCSDGEYIYMSDGTPFLTLRDRETFEVVFDGLVTFQGSPVPQINELECVGDYVYANIWQTDVIVQIDKTNGVVVGVIDASTLLPEDEKASLGSQQVLNGIAYNPDDDTFFITGKEWPKMFKVRFVEAETSGQGAE